MTTTANPHRPTEPSTITTTLPCPSWCTTNHSALRPDGHRRYGTRSSPIMDFGIENAHLELGDVEGATPVSSWRTY